MRREGGEKNKDTGKSSGENMIIQMMIIGRLHKQGKLKNKKEKQAGKLRKIKFMR